MTQNVKLLSVLLLFKSSSNLISACPAAIYKASSYLSVLIMRYYTIHQLATIDVSNVYQVYKILLHSVNIMWKASIQSVKLYRPKCSAILYKASN